MKTMNFDNNISISAIQDDFYSDAYIETKQFSELSEKELSDLAHKCVEKLDEKNKSMFFKRFNLYTKDEIKEEKGIVVSNKDAIYMSSSLRGGVQFLDRTRKLTAEEFRTIRFDPQVKYFIEVSVPEWISKEIDEYGYYITKLKEEKEQKKLKRKIQKAEKLLKEVAIQKQNGENYI